METFSALLVLCAGNSPVTGEFPAQRPVTRNFDVFLYCALNKRLSKQSRGWWFETPSHSLLRHCTVLVIFLLINLQKFKAIRIPNTVTADTWWFPIMRIFIGYQDTPWWQLRPSYVVHFRCLFQNMSEGNMARIYPLPSYMRIFLQRISSPYFLHSQVFVHAYKTEAFGR